MKGKYTQSIFYGEKMIAGWGLFAEVSWGFFKGLIVNGLKAQLRSAKRDRSAAKSSAIYGQKSLNKIRLFLRNSYIATEI